MEETRPSYSWPAYLLFDLLPTSAFCSATPSFFHSEKIQEKMDNPEEWNQLTQQEQEQQSSEMSELETSLKSTLSLTPASLQLLIALTGDKKVRIRVLSDLEERASFTFNPPFPSFLTAICSSQCGTVSNGFRPLSGKQNLLDFVVFNSRTHFFICAHVFLLHCC